MPAGLTADGLPVGLQIVGPARADALVLRAMRAYESIIGWTWPQTKVLQTVAALGQASGR
jgi:Asp-tRNA(Asn)/Glu-tRNA(Gln) amidotransferase A subunit family amidase